MGKSQQINTNEDKKKEYTAPTTEIIKVTQNEMFCNISNNQPKQQTENQSEQENIFEWIEKICNIEHYKIYKLNIDIDYLKEIFETLRNYHNLSINEYNYTEKEIKIYNHYKT